MPGRCDDACDTTGCDPRPAVRADASRLPFPDGRLDAVVAVNMLYHLDDPLTAIAEAHRVLAPGRMFAARAAGQVRVPVTLTKRGALIVARA